MDDVQKSRIRLSHWIDHNEDHLNGYREVAQLLKALGRTAAAVRIDEGVRLTEDANRAFREALAELGGEEGNESHSAHEHGHTHSHEHSHHHGHDHSHSHDED